MDLNSLLIILNQVAVSNFILLVWFHTDAFIEYIKLFKLNKFFRVQKYLDYKNINSSIKYIDFLTIKDVNFLTKLFSCPYCLNFWIILFICFYYNNISYFFIIYMISILTYLFFKKIYE